MKEEKWQHIMEDSRTVDAWRKWSETQWHRKVAIHVMNTRSEEWQLTVLSRWRNKKQKLAGTPRGKEEQLAP